MQKKLNGIARWIGLGIGLLALAYFVYAAAQQLAAFPELPLGPQALVSLAGAVTAWSLAIVLSACAWLVLLRSCGETARATEAYTIFALCQFAKYLPGNLLHYPGRIALARTYGLDPCRVTASIFMEAVLIIVAAAAVATLCLPAAGQMLLDQVMHLPPAARPAVVLSLAVMLLCLAAWVLLSRRAGALRARFAGVSARTPAPAALVYSLVIYAVCFVLMGVAAGMLLRGVWGCAESSLGILTGALAAAWVAGFITPGAPAGLGVREVVLLAVLSPQYGSSTTMQVTIGIRLISILADGICFLGGLAVRRYDNMRRRGLPAS